MFDQSLLQFHFQSVHIFSAGLNFSDNYTRTIYRPPGRWTLGWRGSSVQSRKTLPVFSNWNFPFSSLITTVRHLDWKTKWMRPTKHAKCKYKLGLKLFHSLWSIEVSPFPTTIPVNEHGFPSRFTYCNKNRYSKFAVHLSKLLFLLFWEYVWRHDRFWSILMNQIYDKRRGWLSYSIMVGAVKRPRDDSTIISEWSILNFLFEPFCNFW